MNYLAQEAKSKSRIFGIDESAIRNPQSHSPLLTWREGEDNGPDHKPDRREEQPVAEEAPEIDMRDAGDDHVPEGRGKVAHVIADAHRQNAALNRDADLHRRFRRDESLDRPLAPARRNEDREDRPGGGGQQREGVRRRDRRHRARELLADVRVLNQSRDTGVKMIDDDDGPGRQDGLLQRLSESVNVAVKSEGQKEQNRVERIDVEALPLDDEMKIEPPRQHCAKR